MKREKFVRRTPARFQATLFRLAARVRVGEGQATPRAPAAKAMQVETQAGMPVEVEQAVEGVMRVGTQVEAAAGMGPEAVEVTQVATQVAARAEMQVATRVEMPAVAAGAERAAAEATRVGMPVVGPEAEVRAAAVE